MPSMGTTVEAQNGDSNKKVTVFVLGNRKGDWRNTRVDMFKRELPK